MKAMSGSASKTSQNRGQAIVIIALSFIVLLAFSGLVVDVARVFLVRGQLRRAVDAGGLAAAAQFRRCSNDTAACTVAVTDAAKQLVISHGFQSPLGGTPNILVTTVTTLTVSTCGNSADPALYCGSDPKRKLVKTVATARVPMVFMQLVGFPTIDVAAQNIAEAATVDVVLVLDASESMAYGPGSALPWLQSKGLGGIPNAANLGCNDFGSFPPPYNDYSQYNAACTKACNDVAACHPLVEVKAAATAFINTLLQDYDRVSVVTFDRGVTAVYPLGVDLADANTRVSDWTLYRARDNGGASCPFLGTMDSWRCTSSNIGGGIYEATHQFSIGQRPGSLWVMVVLGSGGADTTPSVVSSDPESAAWGLCPPRKTIGGAWVMSGTVTRKDQPPPLCRDRRFNTIFDSAHLAITQVGTTTISYPPAFDAKDYAAYWGKFSGDTAPTVPNGPGGAGVLIYTIGLGSKVPCTAGTFTLPSTCVPGNADYVDPDTGYPNGGESLLRYIASNSWLANQPTGTSDPCSSAPLATNCGNYYFLLNTNDLRNVFVEIAGKIFTRITG